MSLEGPKSPSMVKKMKKEEMFGHIAELYEVIEYFGREKCETEEENKRTIKQIKTKCI